MNLKSQETREEEKLIRLLVKNEQFENKKIVAQKVNLSINELDLLLRQLQNKGYKFCFHPHLGFQLESIPDKLNIPLMKAGLDNKIIGRKIYIFKSVSSTNDILLNISESKCIEGTVAITERQNQGRGRLGKNWASPVGGIYLSILLKPHIDFKRITIFNLIGAISVANAINSLYEIPISIKWPNDVLLQGKKLAGVLSEIRTLSDNTNILVVGIGINVCVDTDQLPQEAISLKEYFKKRINLITVIWKVLNCFEHEYNLYKNEKAGQILKNWRQFSTILGQQIRITTENEIFEGYVSNIDLIDGGLIIRLDSGLEKKILSGYVEILK